MPQTNLTSHREIDPTGPRGWIERLHDGSNVWIRPIDKHDAALELEFLQGLAPEFRADRFVGLIRSPSLEVARELTDIDPINEFALIAVVPHEGRERQVGAAQFHVASEPDHCDAAVTVSEEWRKRGIGSALMHHLIAAARARGIRHMHAPAPARSEGGAQLAPRLGFRRCPDPNDPATVIYRLEL